MEIAELWLETRQHLLAVGSDGECLPLDPEVLDLVTALNLLGFPTYGSCGGHPWGGEPEEKRYPFVASRFAPPKCHQGERGLMLWRNTAAATRWERRYFALLAWRCYRPLAFTLRDLYDGFCAPSASRPLKVEASWRGVVLLPRSLHEIEASDDPESVTQRILGLQRHVQGFGSFLSQRIQDGRLAVSRHEAS